MPLAERIVGTGWLTFQAMDIQSVNMTVVEGSAAYFPQHVGQGQLAYCHALESVGSDGF